MVVGRFELAGFPRKVLIMTENEFEKKFIINLVQLEKVSDFLKCFEAENSVQINYYYDTPNEVFRGHNITCRIRQKNELLVGTVKKHFVDGECSVERHFKIRDLPYRMTVDGEKLILKGQLITFRTKYLVSESIELVLDKNIYLGVVDYELELEYKVGHKKEAEERINELLKRIANGKIEKNSLSKSERFFRKLNSIDIMQ